MKQLLLLLLVFLPKFADAYDIAVANADGVTIYYNYINDGTELEVTRGGLGLPYSGSVGIPENVTYMGRTRTVTRIGIDAFNYFNHPGPTSIRIPSTVKSIGNEAFVQCTGLKKVIISDIANWCEMVFEGDNSNPLYYAQHIYSDDYTEIIDLVIPEGVTNIVSTAFYYCKSLNSVTIPNSVTSIGNDAFKRCDNLKSVTVGNGLKTIGNNAFLDCKNLKKVIVQEIAAWCGIEFKEVTSNPLYYAHHLYSNDNTEMHDLVISNNVIKVGDYAFGSVDFTSVQSLIVNPSKITSSSSDKRPFSKNTFYNATLYVPIGSIEKYKTTEGWKDFIFIEEFDAPQVPVSGIALNKAAITLEVGESETLTAIITPIDATNKDVIWMSSNNFVAEVDINGVVTAKKAGTTTITAQSASDPELIATCEVTVTGSFINFADATVRAICVANWDTNGDGELSEAEAAAVSDLGQVFRDSKGIISFDELKYFTGLSSIGYAAFSSCTSLSSVTIPKNVTTIGDWALYNCSSLTTITIPNSVNTIGTGAFQNCASMTSVDIPNSVISIGIQAFYGCIELSSITIPNSVTSIGKVAFGGCSKLISVVIPSSITKIEMQTFQDCSSLLSINIPNSVTSIGSRAFTGCTNLTSVTIPSSITSIEAGLFIGCTALTSIIIPNSITSIDDYAFDGCSNLSSINIPEGVLYLGECAFLDCSKLTAISIPNKVTKIAAGTFADCSSLVSITIPASVTNIEWNAFRGCTSLTTVTSLNPTPPTITSNTFSNYTATLNVPEGSKTAYLNAEYWKNFTNIVEIDPSGIQTITLDKGTYAPVYDLNGRKLKEPSKGVNIIGDRKVLLK
ncbi:MAG: leucine-rich repeat protein [Prevotella sp.]|nr:leucine-rich repeat protein [Prevotella sp.]